MLAVGQPGYEQALAKELGGVAAGDAACWVDVPDAGAAPPGGWCFPRALLHDPVRLHDGSVAALARAAVERFAAWCQGRRFEAPFPLLFQPTFPNAPWASRVRTLEDAFRNQLKRRMARVERLGSPELPRGPGTHEGWLALALDGATLACGTRFDLGGQQRMADDPLAPSRSYLKAEEAYVVLGRAPAPGESVVDLGAAPGGWSYGAAKRGARVVAVDNGPLKGGALNHPAIEHRRADAFTFQPATPVDWLLCDLVEEPHHVLRLIDRWFAEGWCRHAVLNFKFGRADPLAVLALLRHPAAFPTRHRLRWHARHLYHDREEFTVVATSS